jgi:hypothetical protein
MGFPGRPPNHASRAWTGPGKGEPLFAVLSDSVVPPRVRHWRFALSSPAAHTLIPRPRLAQSISGAVFPDRRAPFSIRSKRLTFLKTRETDDHLPFRLGRDWVLPLASISRSWEPAKVTAREERRQATSSVSRRPKFLSLIILVRPIHPIPDNSRAPNCLSRALS